MKNTIFLIMFVFISLYSNFEHQYSTNEICSAIYIIEGGNKTKYPYGIKAIKCDNTEECARICHNTVNNNKKRYIEYGYKEYPSFLEFLQSKYCPKSDDLCENWLKNLKNRLNH